MSVRDVVELIDLLIVILVILLGITFDSDGSSEGLVDREGRGVQVLCKDGTATGLWNGLDRVVVGRWQPRTLRESQSMAGAVKRINT